MTAAASPGGPQTRRGPGRHRPAVESTTSLPPSSATRRTQLVAQQRGQAVARVAGRRRDHCTRTRPLPAWACRQQSGSSSPSRVITATMAPGKTLDLHVGGKIGQPAATTIRASAPVTVVSDDTPAWRHCSAQPRHHPLDLGAAALEADHQPDRAALGHRRRHRPRRGAAAAAATRRPPAASRMRTSAASSRSAAARSRRSQAAKAEVSGRGRTMQRHLGDDAQRAQRAGQQAAEVVAGGVFHHAAAGGEDRAAAVHRAEAQHVVARCVP